MGSEMCIRDSFCLAFLETAGDLMPLAGDAAPPILRVAGNPLPVGVTACLAALVVRSSTTNVSFKLLFDDWCCCWNWSCRFAGRGPALRDVMCPDTGLACFLIAFNCMYE